MNIIETLVSQALIGIEISHEEFITILKEKEKIWEDERKFEKQCEKLEEKTVNIRVNTVNSTY